MYYYSAEFHELHRLQTLHYELPGRVGDDRLSARWTSVIHSLVNAFDRYRVA